MSITDWDNIDGCIEEVEWYATRKKNLSEIVAGYADMTWADMLISDIAELRLAVERAKRAAIPTGEA